MMRDEDAKGERADIETDVDDVRMRSEWLRRSNNDKRHCATIRV